MKFIFILICALTGFFTGAFIGAITLPEGSGLAGPAIVIGYGLMGSIIGAVLSAFFAGKFNRKLIVRMIIILALLNLIPIGWMIYRFAIESDRIQPEEPVKRTPTEIKGSILSALEGMFSENLESPNLGLGMAAPDFYNKRQLYFYSKPNFEKSVQDHSPVDSIVFTQTEHHQYDITYAPPWFYPEHLKLDYEIFYLKILTMNREWLEVETNKETGATAWVSGRVAKIYLWPEFLLNVFSIENLFPEINPLRIKPLLPASQVLIDDYEFMTPVLIKDSWVMVDLLDNDLKKLGEGWLMWKDNQKILIRYYLLL